MIYRLELDDGLPYEPRGMELSNRTTWKVKRATEEHSGESSISEDYDGHILALFGDPNLKVTEEGDPGATLNIRFHENKTKITRK